ncbi:MAG: hypothetical protein KDK72_03910 [Chlamydiia bacterium]|nr:hypothetical protein [Chlamydiia bacterium]
MKRLYAFACCALFCWSSHVSALPIQTSVTGSVGYRYELLSNRIATYRTDDSLSMIDDLTLKDIGIYQTNIQGNLFVGKCLQFSVLGGYSDILGGRYSEKVVQFDAVETVATIKGGYGRDFSIIGTYNYPICDNFTLGPSIGFFYSDLKTWITQVKEDGNSTPELEGVNYKNLWRGAKAGLFAQGFLHAYYFSVDYYFYVPVWRASWRLHGHDIPGDVFSDRREANHGYGHSFTINANRRCAKSFVLGTGFTYRYLHAYNGQSQPQAGSFSDVGLSSIVEDRVIGVNWHTLEAVLYLDYCF